MTSQSSMFYTTQTGMKINPTRAYLNLRGTNVVFKPFNVSTYQPLQTMLDSRLVDANTRLMVFTVGPQTLALVMKQMAYHHVAQGEMNGRAWAALFCAGCNMGTTVTPIINGRTHHFSVTGIYNAMSIMSDEETRSSWEHMTGECIHGKLQGTCLTTHTPQYLTVAQALEFAPETQIALSKPSWLAWLLDVVLLNRMSSLTGYMPSLFRLSMTRVDTRLPELELGLGVWIGKAARFYPLKTIKAQGDFLTDTLNRQPLVIRLDPVSGIPTVRHTSEKTLDVPSHQFTRWYGFSYLFPSCEIFSVTS